MKTAIIKINDLLEVEYLPEEIDSFLDKKIDVPGRFEIRKSKSKALIIDDSTMQIQIPFYMLLKNKKSRSFKNFFC